MKKFTRDSKTEITLRGIAAGEKVLLAAVRWGALTGIAWFAYRGIESLAGQETIAHLVASASWPSSPSWWLFLLFFAFGVGGIIYGRMEARTRRETVERMHNFQRQYELQQDPSRTSSQLTARGETRDEDR